MTINKITVSYDAKLSRNYQTAGVSASVEISLEQGEKPGDAFRKAQSWLRDHVDPEVQSAIAAITAPTAGGAKLCMTYC